MKSLEEEDQQEKEVTPVTRKIAIRSSFYNTHLLGTDAKKGGHVSYN